MTATFPYCPACRYDLTGSDAHVCSECGYAFDEDWVCGEARRTRRPVRLSILLILTALLGGVVTIILLRQERGFGLLLLLWVLANRCTIDWLRWLARRRGEAEVVVVVTPQHLELWCTSAYAVKWLHVALMIAGMVVGGWLATSSLLKEHYIIAALIATLVSVLAFYCFVAVRKILRAADAPGRTTIRWSQMKPPKSVSIREGEEVAILRKRSQQGETLFFPRDAPNAIAVLNAIEAQYRASRGVA